MLRTDSVDYRELIELYEEEIRLFCKAEVQERLFILLNGSQPYSYQDKVFIQTTISFIKNKIVEDDEENVDIYNRKFRDED